MEENRNKFETFEAQAGSQENLSLPRININTTPNKIYEDEKPLGYKQASFNKNYLRKSLAHKKPQ